MPLKVAQAPSPVNTRNFVDFLVNRNLIKPGFRQILRGKDILEVDRYLLEKRLFTPERLQELYGEYFRLPYSHILNTPIQPAVVNLIPADVARRYKVLAVKLEGNVLTLAVGEPAFLQKNAPNALLNLRKQKGLRIQLIIVPEAEVMAAINKIYHPAPVISEAKTEAPEQSQVTIESLGTPPVVQPHEITHQQAPRATNKEDLIKEVEPRKTVDLRGMEIPPETLNKLPYAVAKKYKIIVFGSHGSKSKFEQPLIKVALVNPADIHVREILSYIEQRNKVLVQRHETTEESFNAALEQYPESKAEKALKQNQEVKEKETIVAEPPKPKTPSLAEEVSRASQITIDPNAKIELTTENLQPAASEPVQKPVSQKLSDQGLSISAADIINRPTEESASELQQLAKQQQTTIEDQNLDKLLKQPVTSPEDLAKSFRTGFVPEIVAATLFLAIRMKASDVHIESGQETVRVRYRIDGILHDVIRVPAFLHAPLISRIKILAKMKIDEQRVPQDGRFDVVIDSRQVDLRVSTLPTVHGEKVVMRLLDKSEGIMTLEQLGVTGSNFDTLIANIKKPYGVILSTGPTGSGKSTTLYAILSRISKPGVNIITLEDPVEYELPGINQAQVKPGIGFTFAEGLRSVLRQDPNIIMVGEIRDLETAAMATHAALTGHLVLSTLHTNDASGALPRLINMGVEPFLITSSINAVIGQRLVRKVCDNCREKVEIPPAVKTFVKKQLSEVPSGQLKNLDLEQLTFYHGKGCPNCTNGYRGRIGIFEVLAMNEKIEELAVKKAPASEIKRAAIDAGMITMTQDGLIKALKGITTIDEVMRVTTADSKELPGG